MIAQLSVAAGLLNARSAPSALGSLIAPTRKRRDLADAQVPAHRFEALAELAVAVEIRDAAVLELREDFLHPDQHAGQPHLGQAAGALEREQDDLVDVAVPVLLRPAPEMAAADQPGLVVVGAEVGRAGMRHFDRDQRDVGLAVLGGDDRRDVLVGLELDDEVDLLADEDVGVALRDLRAVAVVDAMSSMPWAAAARCRPVDISFENW